MSTQTVGLPLLGLQAGFRRFTVAEYNNLIDIGLLTENEDLELLEGYLIHKMPRNPPHDGTIQLVVDALAPATAHGWCLRGQSAITLSDSQPEPDVVVARGTKRSYLVRHPVPGTIGLVIEVAESTLDGDRIDKSRIYARAAIPYYWIVNLVDHQVEVYEAPSGPTATPEYGIRTNYKVGDAVPLVLDGATVAQIPVAELLP